MVGGCLPSARSGGGEGGREETGVGAREREAGGRWGREEGRAEAEGKAGRREPPGVRWPVPEGLGGEVEAFGGEVEALGGDEAVVVVAGGGGSEASAGRFGETPRFAASPLIDNVFTPVPVAGGAAVSFPGPPFADPFAIALPASGAGDIRLSNEGGEIPVGWCGCGCGC